MQKNKVTVLFADPYGHYSRPLASTAASAAASNQPPLLQPCKKKNGVDSDQCYSSVYVPNTNHHLIESSFSSSSTRCGLSTGHSSSGQDSLTCKRGHRPGTGKNSASCSSGSEDNSLCRTNTNVLNGNYSTKENWVQNQGPNLLIDPIVVQQEVRNSDYILDLTVYNILLYKACFIFCSALRLYYKFTIGLGLCFNPHCKCQVFKS